MTSLALAMNARASAGARWVDAREALARAKAGERARLTLALMNAERAYRAAIMAEREAYRVDGRFRCPEIEVGRY